MHPGVDMGARLLPAGPGNPRGHHEDLDFLGFHRRALLRRGLTPFTLAPGVPLTLDEAERAEAQALVAARREIPRWGFKDPRAILLLPFWHELLPDPFYVLVYRHPIEVVRSLLARGLDVDVNAEPSLALDAWADAAARTLVFHAAHASRCVLWNIAGVARELDRPVAELDRRLGLVRTGPITAFHADELHTGGATGGLAEERPDVAERYAELERRADVPGGEPEGEAAPFPLRAVELVEAARPRLAARALGAEVMLLERERDRATAENAELRAQVKAEVVENQRLRALLAEPPRPPDTLRGRVRFLLGRR